MERIRLTRDEKKVFRLLIKRDIRVPEGMTVERHYLAALSLKEKGLVNTEDGLRGIKTGSPTLKGSAYLKENPKLRNPLPVDEIIRVVTVIGAFAAVAALIVGCCRLLIVL